MRVCPLCLGPVWLTNGETPTVLHYANSLTVCPPPRPEPKTRKACK